MVQPYNYAIQTPSAFESLVSGLKLGTSLQEMQAQQQLRQAQAEQIRQKMEADRARTLAMQEFRAKPFSELTQGDIAGLQGLLPPEAVKGIQDAFGSMRADERKARAGQLGEMASVALNGSPDAIDAWFGPRIEAEQDPVRRKALETWQASAKTNPQALAKTLVTLLSANEEGQEVAKNLIEMYGLKAKEPEKDPEDIRTMRLLGLAITPENYEKFKQAGQRPEAGSALQKAQAYRQTLIAQGRRDTPEFKENQRYIDNLLVDRTALTQAQIRANELSERRIALLEQQNDPTFRAQMAAAEAAGTAAGRQQVERASAAGEINTVVSELERALEKGGLIDRATGSGIGALRDVVAGFVGEATPGAIAIGQLQPIADLVLKIVPRFEGPQSDKDTQSYREAAGKLADPTVPNEIRRAAAKEIVRVFRDRKGRLGSTVTIPMQPAGGAMPAAGAAPAATGAIPPQAPATTPSAGFPTPPQAAIDALRAGRGTPAQFDEVFGPGAAARVMGR